MSNRGNSQSHRRSRTKGRAWEQEVARILRERGWSAKRGLQSRDGSDAPDVVTDLPLWPECKAGRDTKGLHGYGWTSHGNPWTEWTCHGCGRRWARKETET